MVLEFSSLPEDAAWMAGGKGANLGRMSAAGFPVPPGFVICAEAFRAFLEEHRALDTVERLSPDALEEVSRELRAAILSHPIPAAIHREIERCYRGLGADVPVAVRSSAVCEDGEAASFAGQQETFLNVRGSDAVTRSVRACWASFFTPHALFYRSQKGALSDTRMAVVVQEMACGEKSGVMFTVDPVSKRRDRVVVEAVFGLGEGIVSGLLTPDHYVLDRDTGRPIQEFIAVQTVAIVHDPENGGTREIALDPGHGSARALAASELEALRRMGLRLEQFFGRPQDIEWCIRGGDLFLLQSRPITTI